MRTESTPGARGPAPRVDTHADSCTGCASWTEGSGKVLSRQFSADARRATRRSPPSPPPGSRPASREDVVLRGGPHQAPRAAGDARARGASPARMQRKGPRGRASATRRTRRGPPARRCPARAFRDPQEPGRVGRRGALHARGAPGAVARGPRRSTPRGRCSPPRRRSSGRGSAAWEAEADGGVLRARRGRPGDAPALATVGRRDAALDMERAIEASLARTASALLAMYGCGPVSAAKLAVAAGVNPGRLRSEASPAAICGRPAPSPPRAARP